MNENELKLKAELSKLLASWKPEIKTLFPSYRPIDLVRSAIFGMHYCQVALAWERVYGEKLNFQEPQVEPASVAGPSKVRTYQE